MTEQYKAAEELLQLDQQLFRLPQPKQRDHYVKQLSRRLELVETIIGANSNGTGTPRLYLRVPTASTLSAEIGETGQRLEVTDLGMGGLGLQLNGKGLVAGQEVSLRRFWLDGKSYPVDAQCRVVWLTTSSGYNPPRAGIEFTKFSDHERRQVLDLRRRVMVRYLQSLAELQLPPTKKAKSKTATPKTAAPAKKKAITSAKSAKPVVSTKATKPVAKAVAKPSKPTAHKKASAAKTKTPVKKAAPTPAKKIKATAPVKTSKANLSAKTPAKKSKPSTRKK